MKLKTNEMFVIASEYIYIYIYIFVRRRRADGRSSALLTIQILNLQPAPSSRSWNFLYQYNLFVLSELSLDSLENKKIWTIID